MYNDYRALHNVVEDRHKNVQKAARENREFRIATGKPLHQPNVVTVIATLLLKALGMG